MKTGIIITVYNRAAALTACLRALAVAPAGIDEVIVADDGSDEDQARAMRQLCTDLPLPIKYTRQEHDGYRLAAARNNALRAATADYIISIDCDILLLPDAVSQHRRLARRGRFLAGNRALLDQDASERILRPDFTPNDLEAAWRLSDGRHLRRAHRSFMRNRLLRRLHLARRHKPKILGCHFSLFREDIEKINGFDEHFVGWGMEDDDFALRLHQAGLAARPVILTARAMHLWHPTVASKPVALRGTPNAAYFNRTHVATRCRKGLVVLPS